VPPKRKCVAVLTADIINSKGYSSIERRRVNRVLLKSFNQIVRLYADAIHTPLGFRITAGDEFQCVFSDIPNAFDILTYMRALAATSKVHPRLQFRASIGVGGISVSTKSNSYEEDGEAFFRSRMGLDQLGRFRLGLTRIVTGQSEFDNASNTVLLFMDDLLKDWTAAQWEAIRWTLDGLTREQISRKLQVAHQNITKRLAAARWRQFSGGSVFLSGVLQQAGQQCSGIPTLRDAADSNYRQ
jgi:hypothetical protein